MEAPEDPLAQYDQMCVLLYTSLSTDQIATVLQRKISTQLEALHAPYVQLDGVDPVNAAARRALWKAAGVKPGTYPIFYHRPSGIVCSGDDAQALFDSGMLAARLAIAQAAVDSSPPNSAPDPPSTASPRSSGVGHGLMPNGRVIEPGSKADDVGDAVGAGPQLVRGDSVAPGGLVLDGGAMRVIPKGAFLQSDGTILDRDGKPVVPIAPPAIPSDGWSADDVVGNTSGGAGGQAAYAAAPPGTVDPAAAAAEKEQIRHTLADLQRRQAAGKLTADATVQLKRLEARLEQLEKHTTPKKVGFSDAKLVLQQWLASEVNGALVDEAEQAQTSSSEALPSAPTRSKSFWEGLIRPFSTNRQPSLAADDWETDADHENSLGDDDRRKYGTRDSMEQALSAEQPDVKAAAQSAAAAIVLPDQRVEQGGILRAASRFLGL